MKFEKNIILIFYFCALSFVCFNVNCQDSKMYENDYTLNSFEKNEINQEELIDSVIENETEFKDDKISFKEKLKDIFQSCEIGVWIFYYFYINPAIDSIKLKSSNLYNLIKARLLSKKKNNESKA